MPFLAIVQGINFVVTIIRLTNTLIKVLENISILDLLTNIKSPILANRIVLQAG